MAEVEMWYERERRIMQGYSAPIRFLYWLGIARLGRKSGEAKLATDGSWEYVYPETPQWPFRVAPIWMWKAMLRRPIAMSRNFGVFGVFRNQRGFIKYTPGTLLPRRWGFHILGLIEIGHRG